MAIPSPVPTQSQLLYSEKYVVITDSVNNSSLDLKSIGRRYFSSDIEASQTLMLARYLNEGYEQASVSVERRFDDSLNFVDVVFRVHEGVQVLVDQNMKAGYHNVTWNADGISSGMYFVRVETGTNAAIQKLMLLK